MLETTPRERRREKSRQSIVRAARKLITEKGLEGLSLRQLARRVDYSPAALYEYFGGKDEILMAIALEALEKLSTYLHKVPGDLPPARRLVELGLAYLDFARHDPELYTEILPSLPPVATSWQELLDEDSPYGVLIDAIRQGIEAGDFVEREGYGPVEMAFGCWALVHGLAMLEHTNLRRVKTNFGATNRSVVEAFVRGLQNTKEKRK